MTEWHWDGSIWDFIETIQWTLVFMQLSKDKPEGWSEMVSAPKTIKKKAAEYGMPFRAITDEMLRIGSDLNNMLLFLEKPVEPTE